MRKLQFLLFNQPFSDVWIWCQSNDRCLGLVSVLIKTNLRKRQNVSVIVGIKDNFEASKIGLNVYAEYRVFS